MDNNLSNNHFQGRNNSNVAISAPGLEYGRVAVLAPFGFPRERREETLGDKFKFFYGEYFSGILFVTALLLYILLMPAGIKNPVKYLYVMLDKMFKKVLDFGGALVGLILALPIFVIFATLIKPTSRGPVFYVQERIGIDRRRRSRRIDRTDVENDDSLRERRCEDYFGRPFRVVKFRTMVDNVENNCGPVWATNGDSRITRLGLFMRKTRIDEVPQLLNVLKGDMSIVGPCRLCHNSKKRLFLRKNLP